MVSSYERLKKWRELHRDTSKVQGGKEKSERQQENERYSVGCQSEVIAGFVEDTLDFQQSQADDSVPLDLSDSTTNCDDNSWLRDDDSSLISTSDDNTSLDNSSCSSTVSSDDDYQPIEENCPHYFDVREEIHAWALEHQTTLTQKCTSDMLSIWRKAGYESLPKTSQTLLGTEHRRVLQNMPGSKNNTIIMGQYTYLGIKQGLQKIILPEIYTEEKISIVVHVDGMQVYKNSSTEIWPIAVKVHHQNYITKPFAAGIYCGKAKPFSASAFLHDFVQEVNELIEHGVELNGKLFSLELLAVIADSPARAFLKCCRPPGSYFACERCEIEGETMGKKRVYDDINCTRRSKESFEAKSQPEHHNDDETSPLTEIKNFDAVSCTVLDIMHLFHLGGMKWLAEKWILRKKNPARLKLCDVRELKEIMAALKSDIPSDFQRNEFDVSHVSRWKATQFKFLLNYCGAVVLKDILSPEYYEHFMFFVVASRIVNSKHLVKTHCDYAEGLFIKFFTLLQYYGPACKVLSWHNFIHVVDDARKFQMPLEDFSAFWGENFIGKFKDLVKSHSKPLTQIVNRLGEQHDGNRMAIKKKYLLSGWLPSKNQEVFDDWVTVHKLKIHDVIIKAERPDNIIQLKSGEIFLIRKIWVKKQLPKFSDDIRKICFEGQKDQGKINIFTRPTPSADVGIFEVKDFSSETETVRATNFQSKCAMLHVKSKKYVIRLLHSEVI